MLDPAIAPIVTQVITEQLPVWLSEIPKLANKARKAILLHSDKCFTNYYSVQYKKQLYVKTLLNEDPVSLNDIYVPQELTHGDDQQLIVDFNQLIGCATRSFLIGTAGTGKSMAFRYLFLQCLSSRQYLPLFLYLRSVNDNEDSLLSILLASVNKGAIVRLTDEDFSHLLSTGKLCLFLDGFDEIIDAKKPLIEKQIQEIAEQYPLCPIFLSSRPMNTQSWELFRCFHVEPLTLELSVLVIEQSVFADDIKKRFIALLKSTLHLSHDTFTSSPLLLSLMLVMFSKNAEIPKKWHLFYEQAYETLFHRHDASKPGGYQRVYKSHLAMDDFGRIFAALCFICLQQGLRPMTSNYLKKSIKSACKLVSLKVDADDYLDDLQKRVCLILQDGFEYSYAHKTFVEFFAGKFVAHIENRELIFTIANSLATDSNISGFFDSFFNESPEVFISSYAIPVLGDFKKSLSVDGDFLSTLSYKEYLKSLKLTLYRFSNHSKEHHVALNTDNDSHLFQVYMCL